MKKNKINKFCNRCNKRVITSDTDGYSYQCLRCDEDLYSFETYKKLIVKDLK